MLVRRATIVCAACLRVVSERAYVLCCDLVRHVSVCVCFNLCIGFHQHGLNFVGSRPSHVLHLISPTWWLGITSGLVRGRLFRDLRILHQKPFQKATRVAKA